MSTAGAEWGVGDKLEERTLPPVTRLDLIRYAGASGDYNPIHTIDAEAERAGLPGIIQHGMLTMARMGSLFSPYLEGGYVKQFRTRFMEMVRLGDELTIGGTVTGVEEVQDGKLFRFDVYARNADGKPAATGTVEFLAFGE